MCERLTQLTTEFLENFGTLMIKPWCCSVVLVKGKTTKVINLLFYQSCVHSSINVASPEKKKMVAFWTLWKSEIGQPLPVELVRSLDFEHVNPKKIFIRICGYAKVIGVLANRWRTKQESKILTEIRTAQRKRKSRANCWQSESFHGERFFL